MSDDRSLELRAESPARRRRIAALAGLLCHGTFVVAVSAMWIGLWNGLEIGQVRLQGLAAWGWNLALVLQFPLVHSLLLTKRGRGWLARRGGERHGTSLVPTLYAFSAGLQILATFALWSPSGIVWWRPTGWALVGMTALYLAAWLFLLRALSDGGLGLQTGWIGWTAVWRGRRVEFPPLAQDGVFALCRQPIYLGFALTLWTGPIWTPDRLLLASLWTLYCLVGPLHKERRFLRQHGEAFAAYQRRVPYILPLGRKAA